MTLKSDLQALPKRTPRTFKDWLAVADPEEAAIAIEAISNTNHDIDPLLTIFRNNGIPITQQTIKAYREPRD